MPDLKEIYLEVIQEHSPDLLVKKALKKYFKYQGNKPLYVIGVGKASLKMAAGIIANYGDTIVKGLIITPKTDLIPSQKHFGVCFGSHPIPDENSLEAGSKLIEFVKSVPGDGILVTLISGGASSLVVQPAKQISVQDIRLIYELLINSGANIHEINVVRKHLSKIKGGQLLQYVHPDVELIDFIISDVPGDDLEVIGSGLTIPDSSTFEDAKAVLVGYNLWNHVPESVCEHIKNGVGENVPETTKPGAGPIYNHQSHIIGSAKLLAQSFVKKFKALGWQSFLANEYYNDNVEKVAQQIAHEAIGKLQNKQEKKPQALVYYGESTVNVTGNGKGGRNQELALRGALKIDGHSDITWLSVDTDGIDGPTDAAGALVSGDTISMARAKGIDAKKYLENNDSYHFHEQMDTLFKTGPTGNNMMDIQIIVIE